LAGSATNGVTRTVDRELLLAAGQGQVARAETLLKAGANINAPQPPWHLTPLLVASGLSFDMVKLLLAHGADVNVADRDGTTPLMKAIDVRDMRMASLLLDSSAQINAKDHRGHTALTRAVLRSDAPMLKMLIARGADVDVVTEMGTTPWSIAQSMRAAALAMPDRPEASPHHVHTMGQASHPMRNRKESLAQTQAVLDVLKTAGVQRAQEQVTFDAMKYHHH
jgi:ankyrin repeat protein